VLDPGVIRGQRRRTVDANGTSGADQGGTPERRRRGHKQESNGQRGYPSHSSHVRSNTGGDEPVQPMPWVSGTGGRESMSATISSGVLPS